MMIRLFVLELSRTYILVESMYHFTYFFFLDGIFLLCTRAIVSEQIGQRVAI